MTGIVGETLMNDIIITEKPDWISYEDIFRVMSAAHAAHPEVDYTTRDLTQEDVKRRLSGGGCVFVAMSGGKPVGTMTINIEQKNPRWYITGTVGVLRYIAVLPEYAGRGLASRLVAACMEWAVGNGVDTVIWDTAFNNIGAVKTAEKNHFRKVSYKKLRNIDHPTIRLARWLGATRPGRIKCTICYWRDYLRVRRSMRRQRTKEQRT